MKTIEDAAIEAVKNEFLCDLCNQKDYCYFCGGENTAFDCCECSADLYEDGFKAGVNHIMSLPLADRLSAEEAAAIRAEYEKTYPHDIDAGLANKCMAQLLERIFGKEFFEGKGGNR